MQEKVSNTLENLFSLEGKTGIVTGGSSGIGLATAELLSDAGARVFALSRTGKVKDGYAPGNSSIIHIKADVTNKEELKKIVDSIGTEYGLDFIVNNAGITKKERAEDFGEKDWEMIHKLNVDSVFFMSQIAYPYLKQSRYIGRIVNISSMAAHLGFSEVVPYCSSKSAVTGITRGLAVEWAADNILVNSVAPGWFPSKMTKQVMDEDRKNKILNRMPLHKFGDTRDIAAMILFLVSSAGSYITGQDFAVDGGALAFGY